MRVLVTGSRSYDRRRFLWQQLDGILLHHPDMELCYGDATGADALAKSWGDHHLPDSRHKEFKADWKEYGAHAGPIRNQIMLDTFEPTIVLAFPESDSKGTWDMVKRAKAAGVKVKIYQ